MGVWLPLWVPISHRVSSILQKAHISPCARWATPTYSLDPNLSLRPWGTACPSGAGPHPSGLVLLFHL